MKMRTLAITIVSLMAVMLVTPVLSEVDNQENTHEYAIGVKGTEGVKLRMYLVAKRSANCAPTLQEEIVTVPFETEFKASTFYVWFHTLGGDEDINVYSIRSVYKIDGDLQGAGFGLRVKKGNKVKTGFGNL